MLPLLLLLLLFRYVDYFSEIVIDGLSAAIICTVRYLLNQLDPDVLAKTEGAPLMEIQLELMASEIVWKPELTEGKIATSVRDMVRSRSRSRSSFRGNLTSGPRSAYLGYLISLPFSSMPYPHLLLHS